MQKLTKAFRDHGYKGDWDIHFCWESQGTTWIVRYHREFWFFDITNHIGYCLGDDFPDDCKAVPLDALLSFENHIGFFLKMLCEDMKKK